MESEKQPGQLCRIQRTVENKKSAARCHDYGKPNWMMLSAPLRLSYWFGPINDCIVQFLPFRRERGDQGFIASLPESAIESSRSDVLSVMDKSADPFWRGLR